MRKQKSQAWSFDIMLATVIFLGTLFYFFLIMSNSQEDMATELKRDTEQIVNSFFSKSNELNVVDGEEVDESKLENLLEQDYGDLKKQIGTEHEFCIYLEDENGNVIFINSSFTGIGSNEINVSGIPCG